jgi:GH24 family phage-related lysozyme (muramidase)
MAQNQIRLIDLFKYYKALPHQMAAIAELETVIGKANPHILGRNQSWFKAWSQSGKQVDLAPAYKLIKEFESCHLEAYPDPLSGGEPWTIGYGTTRYQDGRKVEAGDKIDAVVADILLRQEVDRICNRLAEQIPYWVQMTDNQKSALISFAYNLGSGFYGSAGFETITRRLAGREWAHVPAALLLYRNPGTRVEAGLRRRREAEGRLWTEGAQLVQIAARLNVPYFSQRDNASGQGYRECFSSSCAMIAAFYDKVKTDDQYNEHRSPYGDTTEATAQTKTLKALGLESRFAQNLTAQRLEDEIDAGRPIAVGWLHRGTVSLPNGSGHWSVVVGYTPQAFIHHDPYGEADLVGGGYVNAAGGKYVAYSRKNWLRRWEVDGPGTGWGMLISGG